VKLKWIMSLSGFALAVFALSTMLIPVSESHIAVVSQFGKIVEVRKESGLLVKLPEPLQVVTLLDKRQQLLPLDSMEFITRDGRNVVADSFILWRISDAQKFLRSVRNVDVANVRLRDLALSEIGSALGNSPLSALINTQASDAALTAMFTQIKDSSSQKAMEAFGITISAIYPSRLSLPQPLIADVYKRMSAERSRIAQQLRAEGQEEAAKIKADTEYEVRRKQAEAYRDSQIVQGEAEAEASRIYASVYESHPEFYQYLRSLQSYEKILNEKTRLVISTETPVFKYLWSAPESRDAQTQ